MWSSEGTYGVTIRPRSRGAADEYWHEGNTWIEGREGSTYTIDITNRTTRRALFVVSVDGLDVLEGKPAGLQSRGYVLNAGETVSVPGWKLNNSTAAEFYFSRSSNSYVNNIGGNVSNTGVIGVMVFAEHGVHAPTPYNDAMWNHLSAPPAWNPKAINAHMVRSLANNVGICSSSAHQDVGTGFGDATPWHTRTEEFHKEDANNPNAIMVIYYNTAKNLEKMGIQLRRKHNPSYKANPFPAYSSPGCVPPPGWRGS
jgi:hypothetical protein